MTRQPQGPADVAAANQSLNSRLKGRLPAGTTTDRDNADDSETPRLAGTKRYRQSTPVTTPLNLPGNVTASASAPSMHSLARPLRSLTAVPNVSSLNALPSPAQSDEPSPASAANPPDSPNSPRQAPVLSIDSQVISQALERPLHNNNTEYSSPMPANGGPDTSFASVNTRGTQRVPQSNTRHVSCESSPARSIRNSADLQSQYHQKGLDTNVPGIPVTSGASTLHIQRTLGPNTPVQSPQSPHVSVQPGPYSSKRQRLDLVSYTLILINKGSMPFATWAKSLKNYLDRTNFENADPNNMDRRRLYLLEHACHAHDYVYLQIHQIYCRWSCDPSGVYSAMPAFDRETIDMAFRALRDMLASNQSVSRPALNFFIAFPVDFLPISQEALGRCLTRLARNWDAMVNLILQRRRPPLVNELIYLLGCDSPGLQCLVFIRARRSLQVMDHRPQVQEIEALFSHDQEVANLAYMKRSTLHMQHRTPSDWQLFENENMALVQKYIQLVMAANLPASMASGVVRSSLPFVQQAASSNPHPLSATAVSQSTPSPSLTRQGPAVPTRQQLRLPSTMMQENYAPVRANNMIYPYSTPNQAYTPGSGSVSFQNQSHEQSLPFGQQVPNSASHYLQHRADQPYHRGAPYSQHLNGLNSGYSQQPNTQWQYVQPPRPQTSIAPGVITPHASSLPTQPSSIRPNRQLGHRNSQSADPVPFFPPARSVIPQSQHARAPNDLVAYSLGLHQVDLRSPVRHVRALPKSQNADEHKYFQFIRGFAVPPSDISPSKKAYEFSFDVNDIALLSRSHMCSSNIPQLPLAEHFEGSVRLRLRCCRIKESAGTPNEPDWITFATSWPQRIFISLFADEGRTRKGVKPRRAPQNSKDLPTDITDMVLEGINKLTVSVDDRLNDPGYRHFLAVEWIETRSFSKIIADVYANQVLDPKATLEDIQRKAGWTCTEHDEDIQMEVGEEYKVDLTCPFMATIWETPVRGANCVHIQCFDLKTWLKSRTQIPHRPECQTHAHPCDCFSPKLSIVDDWKCPICNEDARPQSLRIDGFLAEVRRKLESEGNLRNTKTLIVFSDSSWKPIKEEDDDDDDDEDEIELDGRRGATNGTGPGKTNVPVTNANRPPLVSHGPRRSHHDIIDLLSDED
ncbi:hypothetical protein PpBr36_08909 [Pyricularia pennisetigena]|uniref:hypothetical protein n=1 Tax=Pyricularia pennisetigena TaxID=1578925 RepID=UPI001153E15E|nr:hypothetical protein PpBr36_08909 [Pyricularia pennisetigena]TLS24264.1 hypothetical protein PpBr36_08909 [Pyricularia pennisetigena]